MLTKRTLLREFWQDMRDDHNNKNKYVAIKGRPAQVSSLFITYYCESYSVSMVADGVAQFCAQVLSAAGICNLHKFIHSMLSLYMQESWFRDMVCVSFEEVIDEMAEQGLLLIADGSEQEATRKILDNACFLPILRAGTEDKATVDDNENYFRYLLNRKLLTSLERKLLTWIESRYALLSSKPHHVRNSLEISEKQCNMDTIKASACFHDVDVKSIYDAVASLLAKHCIVLADKVPRHPTQLNGPETTQIPAYAIYI